MTFQKNKRDSRVICPGRFRAGSWAGSLIFECPGEIRGASQTNGGKRVTTLICLLWSARWRLMGILGLKLKDSGCMITRTPHVRYVTGTLRASISSKLGHNVVRDQISIPLCKHNVWHTPNHRFERIPIV